MPTHPAAPASLPDLVAAYRQTAEAVVELGRSCTAADFARPTECPGWTVQDQISHVASLESMFAGEPPLTVDLPELAHVRSDFGRFMELGVHARRSHSGAEVVEELARVLPSRVAALSNPELTLESVIESPIGPRPAGGFVALRTRDIWCHEQDLRVALGRPLSLDAPGCSVFADGVLGAVPVLLARDVKAPVGTTVVVEMTAGAAGEVTGSIGARVDEGEGGKPRGVAVDPAELPEPTARITLTTEALTRRGAGRRSVADTPYAVSGDPALVAALLEELAITP